MSTKYDYMINSLRKLAELGVNDGTPKYIIETYLTAAEMIAELQNVSAAPQQAGFLRLPDVLRVFPVSKTSWYRGIENGLYPKPVNIGMRSIAWRVEDINSLIEKANNGGFSE